MSAVMAYGGRHWLETSLLSRIATNIENGLRFNEAAQLARQDRQTLTS